LQENISKCKGESFDKILQKYIVLGYYEIPLIYLSKRNTENRYLKGVIYSLLRNEEEGIIFYEKENCNIDKETFLFIKSKIAYFTGKKDKKKSKELINEIVKYLDFEKCDLKIKINTRYNYQFFILFDGH